MSRMGRNPFQQPKPAKPHAATPNTGPAPRTDSAESTTGVPESMVTAAAKLLSWAATEIPARGIVLAVKTVGFVAGNLVSRRRPPG